MRKGMCTLCGASKAWIRGIWWCTNCDGGWPFTAESQKKDEGKR